MHVFNFGGVFHSVSETEAQVPAILFILAHRTRGNGAATQPVVAKSPLSASGMNYIAGIYIWSSLALLSILCLLMFYTFV